MDFQGDYVQNNWVGKQTFYKQGDDYEDIYNQLKITLEDSFKDVIDMSVGLSVCEPGCIIQINPSYDLFVKTYTDYYIAMEGLFNTIYDTKKSGIYEYEIGSVCVFKEPDGFRDPDKAIIINVNFNDYQNYTPDVYKDYEKKLRLYQKATKTILEEVVKIQFSTPTNYTNFTKDDYDL